MSVASIAETLRTSEVHKLVMNLYQMLIKQLVGTIGNIRICSHLGYMNVNLQTRDWSTVPDVLPTLGVCA
jgi:hypothetical protein